MILNASAVATPQLPFSRRSNEVSLVSGEVISTDRTATASQSGCRFSLPHEVVSHIEKKGKSQAQRAKLERCL